MSAGPNLMIGGTRQRLLVSKSIMRRLLPRILIGSFTFVLGVVVTSLLIQLSGPSVMEDVRARTIQQSKHDSIANMQILPFCELANNPEKYSGQIVRVKARLSGFIHGILFSDADCMGVDKQTAVFYDPGYSEDIKRDLKEARGSDDWLIPLDIVAVGTFWKVNPSIETDTIYDTASLRFEIIRIEEASMVR